jgi:hypothetical protein
MSIESIVFSALAGSGAGALVANPDSPTTYRIYPEAAPQTTGWPVIVYNIIGQEQAKSLGGGPASIARTLVQVDSYAKTQASARAIADAVTLALFGNFATFSGLHQNRQNLYDEQQRLFRVSQDFAIWA